MDFAQFIYTRDKLLQARDINSFARFDLMQGDLGIKNGITQELEDIVVDIDVI